MPRLTELDEVLFPVEEHPVFAVVATEGDERRLPVPEKKAIINAESGRVLGIVSRGYHLVTNHEALDWAYQCCRIVFPDTQPGEWGVRATDAPSTGGHCFIDLIHNSTALDFEFVPPKDRPDAFGPFIRVTNSYNGRRALAFDIGFFRKVCTNGMILPESVVRFKFTHLDRDIGETIKFDVARERLEELTDTFGKYLGVLRQCEVRRSLFKPLVCGVLLIRKPKNAKPDTREDTDWEALENHLKELCSRYAKELGENAYAVFNAITEFASHPPHNRCVRRERHSFERLAGAWLYNFSRKCQEPGFSVDEYLENLGKTNGDSKAGKQAADMAEAAGT